MKIAKYENPQFNSLLKEKKRGNVKIACVMATYVPVEMNEILKAKGHIGGEMLYKENKLDSIKLTLNCYEHFNAGMPFDLFIVDSSSPNEDWLEFLNTLKYPHYSCENNGWSFGAYKWVWENVPEIKNYDYLFFHEQDYPPSRDNWLKELFDIYLSDPEIGSIGNVVEERIVDETEDGQKFRGQRNFLEIDRDYFASLDGCYHFISKDIIEECGIKTIDTRPKNNTPETMNEILFEQSILEHGYKIAGFNDGTRLYFHGGVWVMDFSPELQHLKFSDDLAPIIAGYTMLTCPKISEYFDKVKRTYV